MAEITERIEEEYDASQIQVLEGLEAKRLPGIVIISP